MIFPSYWEYIIIPSDEFPIFFRGVAIPPTRIDGDEDVDRVYSYVICI